MNKEIMIGNHKISEDSPTFVIAEMSANHLMDFDSSGYHAGGKGCRCGCH